MYSNLGRDSGGIQNRLGSLAFMVLYLGVMGLSSLPIWRAERLLFIRCAMLSSCQPDVGKNCLRAHEWGSPAARLAC